MNRINSPHANGKRSSKVQERLRLPCISPDPKINKEKILIKKQYKEDECAARESKIRPCYKFEGKKIRFRCLNTSSDVSNSNKGNISTNNSSPSDNSDSPRMLTRDEEVKWIGIHSNLIERVKLKVEYARKSRFFGFISPNILNIKAKSIRKRNIQNRRCLSIDHDSSSSQDAYESFMFKNPNINFGSPKTAEMRIRKAFSPTFKLSRQRDSE